MKDFLIKLLGGYKAVVVIIQKDHKGNVTAVSKMVNFYPFVQMILKTKIGIVSFTKDMKVEFKELK